MTGRTISGVYPGVVSLATAADIPATIAAGATLQAGLYGPASYHWTVDNQGIIQGATAVALADASTFGNAGLVDATLLGVSIYGAGIGMITNSGTIRATDAAGTGVELRTGGPIVNTTTGRIDGGLYAVQSSSAGTLTNFGMVGGSAEIGVGFSQGTVSNAAGATITGSRSGVRLFIGGSVHNAGTISGGADAVHFYAGFAGRLTVDPGAVFVGLVDGGNTIGASFVSTLELSAGTAGQGGTLTGLGSQFVDFAQVTIDAGATWTLAADAIGDGVTLTDSGTLTNAGSLGSAVTLTAGALLVNTGTIARYVDTPGTGTVTAVFAVQSDTASGAATVINQGRIVASNTGYGYGTAINLLSGGSVTNAAGGVILGGGGSPITITGGAASIDNAGSIGETGGGGSAIYLGEGGSVTNATGGVIDALVHIAGAAGTVDNAGTMAGVSLSAGGLIVNRLGADGGTIVAGCTVATTVVNDGRLSSIDLFQGPGAITNQSHGRIDAQFYGVALQDVGESLTNMAGGTITGTLAGVALDAGSVTNQASGVITGGKAGAYVAGGTFDNAGTLSPTGTSGSGLAMQSAAFVTNRSQGLITGASNGVVIGGSGGTLDNAGTIAAGNPSGSGVDLLGGGLVINRTGGTILGQRYGVYFAGALAGTLVNAGTLSGGVFSVRFQQNSGSRLVVEQGAEFDGVVFGGAGTLELGSGVTLTGLGGSYFDFSHVTVDAGGTLSVQSSQGLKDLTNDGTVELTPSYGLGISLALSGSGRIGIDAGSYLYVASTAAASETVGFAGPGGRLLIGNAPSFAAGIQGFQGGETIDLTKLKFVAGASASISAGVLTVSSGGVVDTLNVAGLADDTQFSVTQDAAGNGSDIGVLCFCAGTRIATPQGETAVERLRVGDLVRTAAGAARPVRWIGMGRTLATRGRRSAATPVILCKGALADNVPYRDLRVTKGHAFLLDGVLVPAEFLVNHRSILWDDRAQEVVLYHLELDSHDVLLANGAPAESYRDDGNRWLFQNANPCWEQPAMPPCAPVLTGGPEVDAIWQRLLARAGSRPTVPLTEAPDLHLLADGRRVDAGARHGSAHIFTLGEPPSALHIRSRAGAPAELGLARDPRMLGVALRAIALRQGTRFRSIDAADPMLANGFHSFEPELGLRWTDGDAVLPAALFSGFAGALEVVLHLAGGTRYPLLAA